MTTSTVEPPFGPVDAPDDGDDRVASPPALSAEQSERVRRLVLAEHSFVWRSLIRLGVPTADAEDAVQQVFIVTARRIGDVEPGAERSFLYGVSIRVASRSRRTMTRRREVAGDQGPERVDTGARPDELLDRAKARALLTQILDTMPIELRSVFTLFELEQLTRSEIAGLLGLPEGTIASRLRRAREHFADQRNRMVARGSVRTDHRAHEAPSSVDSSRGGRSK